MARILLFYVLPLALTVYAIVDCVCDDYVERFSIPKFWWIMMIIFLPVAGSLAWLVASKIVKPRTYSYGPPSALPRRSPRRPGPVAPDDNLDFLRDLAEEQARRDRERRRKEKPGGDDSTGSESGRT
ncbi:MAG: PLD nuclease N-terminal domain-containing protein [Bifidobacteriaceae bacterium]|nr:PLD nuclease N-terminal domain-containing protein [Bifidobacteriaceae bacterium]